MAYCDLERGFSPCTISAYASDLRQWRRFLANAIPGNIPRITDVNRQLVRRFIVHQTEAGLSNATVARRVNCLRSFWQFLDQAELVASNPLDSIRLPKTRIELPTYLTDEEMRRLLEAAGRTHYSNLASRDKAVIGMFLFAGLRRAELVGLQLGDVDLSAMTLTVRRAKGGTWRVLPLAAAAADAVTDWLEFRPECDHASLFTTRGGNPMTVRDLHRMFRRTVKRAGIASGDATLHSLRHTFALLLLREGVDVRSLQPLLGHRSLETTAQYLHLQTGDLRAAVDRHPLG